MTQVSVRHRCQSINEIARSRATRPGRDGGARIDHKGYDVRVC